MPVRKKNKPYRINEISRTSQAVLTIVFILFSLACLVPVLLVAIVSITDQQVILENGYSFMPNRVNFLAYEFLFKDSASIFQAYGISFYITIVGTVAGLLLMGLYAYPLSRRDYPYRGFLTFYIFFTMLFNGGLVAKYIVYTKALELQDSLAALILPLLIAPFNVIIMRTFFQTTIHPAIFESAKIDGAGEWKIFFRIVFPLSLPVFATIGLFSTLAYWNDWFNALLFIKSVEKTPLQYLMMKAINDLEFLRRNLQQIPEAREIMSKFPSEGIRMAMVMVGMGPIILVYPFFQKYFIKGLTIGAVKG